MALGGDSGRCGAAPLSGEGAAGAGTWLCYQLFA